MNAQIKHLFNTRLWRICILFVDYWSNSVISIQRKNIGWLYSSNSINSIQRMCVLANILIEISKDFASKNNNSWFEEKKFSAICLWTKIQKHLFWSLTINIKSEETCVIVNLAQWWLTELVWKKLMSRVTAVKIENVHFHFYLIVCILLQVYYEDSSLLTVLFLQQNALFS